MVENHRDPTASLGDDFFPFLSVEEFKKPFLELFEAWVG